MNIKFLTSKTIHSIGERNINGFAYLIYSPCGLYHSLGESQYDSVETTEPITCKTCIKLEAKTCASQ